MLRRFVVIVTLGVGLSQPLLAAEDRSDDEQRMKERLVTLSQGADSLEGLRIELVDGSLMTGTGMRVSNIANGKVVSQKWDSPSSPEQRDEWAVTDDEVRNFLQELIMQHYWTFHQGTSSLPDADGFSFRFYFKDLKPVEYRCDAQEYQQSEQLSAIRAVFLNFVSKNSAQTEKPVTR